jgi:polar amino acid transport system substrate-binding protein
VTVRFAWIAEPPFNLLRGGGVTGCDVELARWVAGRLGETFELVEATFPELLDGLAAGRSDMTTGMFVTAERSARTYFTVPIWSLRDGLLIRSSDTSRIGGYRDLGRSDEQVAVLSGQVQAETAIRLGVSKVRLLHFDDYQDAAAAVADGKALAYASVALAHHAHVAAHPDENLVCVTVPESEKPGEAGAFACRDECLRDRVDALLSGFIGSSEHRALLAETGVSPASLGF